jgi:hypothetical protein
MLGFSQAFSPHFSTKKNIIQKEYNSRFSMIHGYLDHFQSLIENSTYTKGISGHLLIISEDSGQAEI